MAGKTPKIIQDANAVEASVKKTAKTVVANAKTKARAAQQSVTKSAENVVTKARKMAASVDSVEEVATKAKAVVTKANAKAKSVEASLDKAASKVVSKASPAVKATIAKVSRKAAVLEQEVDEIADKVNELGSDVIGNGSGSTVNTDFQYSQKVSRLFIFRFLWAIIQLPIIYFWSIWIVIVSVVHFLYMLLLGKRSRSLWEDQTRYTRHLIAWNSYMK